MPRPAYFEHLSLYDRFSLPIQRQIITWLGLTPNMHTLDAGCGAGGFSLLMAEAGCQVSALDASQEALDEAIQLFSHTAFTANFQQGSVLQLPYENAQFDLVWCSFVIHHVEDEIAAVREIRRVLKPGGKLALREGGLPLRFLPFDIEIGESGLQDRLRVADNRWFVAMRQATMPDWIPYPYGWNRLLRDGGFENVTTRTFLMEYLSPFGEVQNEMLLYTLQRWLGRDEEHNHTLLNDVDRATLKALLQPESGNYILDRDDLHVQIGQSVYIGQKPSTTE